MHIGRWPLRRWRQARTLFTTTVWEVSLEELPAGRAFAYRTARILHSTWKGLHEHHLTARAAALTYFTVLSLVPFLAFAFALLKGFGAYDRFVEGSVRPYLRVTFGANPPLLQALEKVLDFVQDTDVARLGTVGVLVLAYGAVSLLGNVESALNRIWGARTERPLLRQVTDYTTLIVTTPLLMLVATTFATAAQSSGIVTYLRGTWAFGAVIDFFLGLTSLVVTIAAMIALYLILPNVKVRPSSAVLGGVVSGLLWQGALFVHVSSQAGVARYNALYSGFVALPIFLVWTYLSWAMVLVGALVAASHQNERVARQRLRAEAADHGLKETLALGLAVRITRAFLAGEPRPSATTLADELEVSPVVVDEILDALVRAELVAKVVGGGDLGYVPGRDVDETRVSDVLTAIRRKPGSDRLRDAVAGKLDSRIVALTDVVGLLSRSGEGDPTLRELAPVARQPATAAAPARAVERPAKTVVDGKQPELSS